MGARPQHPSNQRSQSAGLFDRSGQHIEGCHGDWCRIGETRQGLLRRHHAGHQDDDHGRHHRGGRGGEIADQGDQDEADDGQDKPGLSGHAGNTSSNIGSGHARMPETNRHHAMGYCLCVAPP